MFQLILVGILAGILVVAYINSEYISPIVKEKIHGVSTGTATETPSP